MKIFRLNFILLTLCILLITACNNSAKNDFSSTETLSPDWMPLQGLTFPYRIDIKYPFLVLQNRDQLKDSLFHIYDLREMKLKHVFGMIGQGPNDFILPTLIQTHLSDLIIQDKDDFIFYDINKEGQISLKKKNSPQFSYNISEAVFINDSLFAVDAMYMGPYVNLCSIQNEIPLKQWKYRDPNIMDYFVDPNRGDICANNERVVFLYTYKKMIDFMDTELNILKRVEFSDFVEPTNIASVPNGDNRSYVGSYLGKKYLYAIYLGTTFNEHIIKSTHNAYIEVFDLNGVPKKRYKLDGPRPGYFAVDEENFILYGTNPLNDPEDHLLVYKLKDLE